LFHHDLAKQYPQRTHIAAQGQFFDVLVTSAGGQFDQPFILVFGAPKRRVHECNHTNAKICFSVGIATWS